MLLFFVLTIFLVSPVAKAVDQKYTALQFGTTESDYIRFNYDMSPFRTSLTLCSWVKRVHTSYSGDVVFHYKTSSVTYEILTGSDGQFNRVTDNRVLESQRSEFTTPAGQWFHYCLTWSSSSQTVQLYLDGELATTGHTSSGRGLYPSGTLSFNVFVDSGSSSQVFGGQLYRFNIYAEVLSSETIKRIADGGLCAQVEENISSRALRWEDLLAKPRSGSVVEVAGCYKEFMEIQLKEKEMQLKAMREELVAVSNKLNLTEGDLVTMTSELNSTQDELQTATSELNSTQDELQTVTGRLNRTEDKLQRTKVNMKSDFVRYNRTKEQLNTCSAALTDSKSQLEGARRFQNITKWDILYTGPYFNKVFTEDRLEKLKSSWDLMSKCTRMYCKFHSYYTKDNIY